MKDANGLPFVTVYTITYNHRDRVELTVRDLFHQTYPHTCYEIIVLDDGSSDGTPELLSALCETSPVPMKIIEETHAADYLSARRWNQCIAAASSETRVFVQIDDVRVRSDFIEKHVAWHCGPTSYLVTGAKFEGDEETWELRSCRRHVLAGPHGTARECDFPAVFGASLSFTKEATLRIWSEPFDRPYDERMTGWGFHELEFAYRMALAGVEIIYDPAVGVFHKNHTPDSERKRGLNRDVLVPQDAERNGHYLNQKHGLLD